MYNYRKRFFYPIHVARPDPEFAQILLEHYAGRDGELSQITQYLSHQANISDRFVRELYGLIIAEELAHLEILSTLIHKLGGELGYYVNNRGEPWKLEYIEQGTDPLQLLKIDIDLELSSRSLYEKSVEKTKDPGIRKILHFIGRREEIHQSLLVRSRKLMIEGACNGQYNQLIYDYKMSLQVLE
ncbi:manganese catalase family protein [Desulfitobacterium metallireducens]|uniref:Mn-containing catalase n=1 Tax=Desulfitobacterium metallireducens DSM 15288 TaxID=871968 RepID=W0E6L2_9FIRM|nr:manganese catalase family protein [Desulfitobacterium metallireducens]AHF06402.1 Mn-containing catalase [Desulfitobacterium metallireducens DSM 15288]